MKENILTMTNRSEFVNLDEENRLQAFLQWRDFGVAFVNKETNKVIVDNLELDDCLEQYSVENWETVKKDLINTAENAINVINDALKRSRYMQVCADYLDSLEDAKDSIYQYIKDLESKTNQYCG